MIEILDEEVMYLQINSYFTEKHLPFRYAHLYVFLQVDKIIDTLFHELPFVQKVLHA